LFGNKDLAVFELAYGGETVKMELPSSHVLRVLQPASFEIDKNLSDLAQDAFQNPIDNPSQIRAEKTLLILPDKTRNCGAKQFLSHLLNHLNGLGVRNEQISVLLANGSHVANSDAEIANIIGEDLAKVLNVFQHNSKNENSLKSLGVTKMGTPVSVNKIILEHEQVIAVAASVHHYFAGFGGGPKMIVPGCAGYRTITRNHSLTIDARSKSIHAACFPGNLKGNPIQEDISDSLAFIDCEPFLFETVLNEKAEIVACFWGSLNETHLKACELVDKIYKTPIKEQADLIVASCGGFPKDINLIQIHKTIYNAYQAVKPGGTLIVLAECSQGIGSSTFMEWFDFFDKEKMIDALSRDFKLNGTTALSLREKASQANIIFVSKLEAELVKKTGMKPARSLDSALAIARTHLPGEFSTYVIPNASLTLPVKGKYDA